LKFEKISALFLGREKRNKNSRWEERRREERRRGGGEKEEEKGAQKMKTHQCDTSGRARAKK
jgi:hypothetical protein